MKKTFLITLIILFLNIENTYSSDFIIQGEEGLPVMNLKHGLKLVTDKSRVLKIVRYNEDIAYAEYYSARSRFFPLINAYVRQTYLANQPGARFGPQEVYTSQKEFLSYGLTLYQGLFKGGSDLYLYRASGKNLEIKKYDINRIKNLIALEFINSYLDLLELERLIRVAEKEVETLEGHLKEAMAMYEEGVITKNERLEIEVRLSDARQRLLGLKNQKAFYTARLNSMLLMPLERELRIEDIEFEDKSEDSIPPLEEAWQEAMRLRAEIKIIEKEIESLGLQEKARAGEYYPELFLQAGYDYTENRYQLHEENWSLIFGVNINLFNGGATTSEINKLRYRRDQLYEEREKLLDDIRLEVKKYHTDLQNALEKIRVTEEAIRQAEENLRINRLRFEEGIGKSTDVLDAIALYALAETNYYRARYDFLRAQAGLKYAIGKDLVAIYGGEDGSTEQ